MVSSTSGLPERAFPWRFVIVAIVVTAVIAGLVGYLGSRGSLGGVIPGERSPPWASSPFFSGHAFRAGTGHVGFLPTVLVRNVGEVLPNVAILSRG